MPNIHVMAQHHTIKTKLKEYQKSWDILKKCKRETCPERRNFITDLHNITVMKDISKSIIVDAKNTCNGFTFTLIVHCIKLVQVLYSVIWLYLYVFPNKVIYITYICLCIAHWINQIRHHFI